VNDSRAPLALAALVVAAATWLTVAQERADPALAVHEEVRLGLLEVVVLDRKGEHVRGLPPSAFRLLEGRDEIPIRTFDEIEVGGVVSPSRQAPVPPPQAAASGEAPGPAAAPGSAGTRIAPREDGPRWIAVLFDGYNNPSPLKHSQARRSAKKWLRENVRENDFVGVYEMTPWLYSTSGFSSRVEDSLAAIDKVRIFPGSEMGTEMAEQRLEQGQIGTRETLEAQLTNAAGFGGDLLAAERDTFYEGMSGLAEIMAGLDGTKAILAFSGGFPVTRSRQALASGGFTVRFKRMLEDLERAGVRVYTMDVGEDGGYTDASEAMNTRLQLDQLGLGTEWLDTLQLGAQVDSVNAHQEILAVVAGESGGRFFAGKDYTENLTRAFGDLSHYYLIGYDPDLRTPKGKSFVPMAVRVEGEGRRVITRRVRHVAEPASASAPPPLPAPHDAVDARALAIACRPQFYPGSDGRTLVVLPIRVQGPLPTLAVAEGQRALDMTLEVTATASGETVASGSRDLRLQVPPDRATDFAFGIHLREALLLPPSAVDLRVDLRLNGLGKSGSWSAPVVVPERRGDRFGLTDLAVFAPMDRAPLILDIFRQNKPVITSAEPVPFPDPWGADATGRPPSYVDGSLPSKAPVLAQVAVVQPPPVEAGESSPLRLDWEFVPDAGGEAFAPPVRYRRLKLAPDGGRLEVVADLDVSAVPPGSYQLRVVAEDLVRGGSVVRSAPVTLAP